MNATPRPDKWRSVASFPERITPYPYTTGWLACLRRQCRTVNPNPHPRRLEPVLRHIGVKRNSHQNIEREGQP